MINHKAGGHVVGEVLCGVSTCGRPVADQAYVCSSCTVTLGNALLEVVGNDGTGLAYELEITLTKQDRISEPMRGARGRVASLPYNIAASDAAHLLRNSLHGWIRVISDDSDLSLPTDDVVDMAMWLMRHLYRVRHHEAGPEVVIDITTAIHAARLIIDKPAIPAARWYAGPCTSTRQLHCPCSCHLDSRYSCNVPNGCEATHAGIECRTELYARAGAPSVCCVSCGTVYDVVARRTWMLEQVEDRLMHSTELAIIAHYLGVKVAAATIRGYAKHGRITPHAYDTSRHPHRPLYRIGDVLEIVLGSRQAS